MVLGLTFDTGPLQATNSVYIAFLCVTSAAVLTAVFSLVPLDEVQPPLIRPDASQRKVSLLGELKLTFSCLSDTRLLTLLLPSFASEISTVAVSTTNGQSLRKLVLAAHAKSDLGLARDVFRYPHTSFELVPVHRRPTAGLPGSIIFAGLQGWR